MLAYRHAFHAGNHADVLKHTVLMAVLRHMNIKDKGWRLVDTHAGAGGYSLQGEYANKRAEYADGIGRLYERRDLPAPLADYVDVVRQFNGGGALVPGAAPVPLVQYPGSPAIAHALQRPQDQLRLHEMHPTEHKILASYLGETAGVAVGLGDGFLSLKTHLPPPTRRGVVLIDPPYELKTDYARTLAALREALTLFPECVVVIWLPHLQLLEAALLPQRLRASATQFGKKGWLHAKLTVAAPVGQGFGLLGSSVFVANPPHTLAAELRPALAWLAPVLAQFDAATSIVEASG